MKTVEIVNGPNLNLLGQREVDIYGREALEDILRRCRGVAERAEVSLNAFQSNCEGQLIERLHKARNYADGVIINPGGLSHTSVVMRDAISCLSVPVVEVHMTNVHAREFFRHTMMTGGAATGIICGLGSDGYDLALDFILRRIL